MKSFKLEGHLRQDLGKKSAKALRGGAEIPAVLYGGADVKHIVVSQEGVRNLIYSPEIFVVELNIDGQEVKAVLKDIQFHPVTDAILHLDFLQVDEQKPVVVEVPVVLQGHAEGVRAGGKLTNLGLGKTIQVGALSFEGLEVINAKNAVVCAVKLTRAARGALAKGK